MRASIKRIQVRDFARDEHYSRMINERHVAKIMANFQADAVGVLIANKRHSNSKIYTIDGNHRLEAMRRLKMPDSMVDCLLFDGMSKDSEARLFVSVNSQIAIHPVDVFRARIVADDPVARDILRYCEKHQYTIRNTSNRPDTIVSVKALEALHKAGTLEEVLAITRKAWPVQTVALPGLVLRVLSELLFRFPGIDRKSLATKLSDYNPSRLVRDVQERKRLTSQQSVRCGVEYVAQLYNMRRKTGRLPEPYRSRHTRGHSPAALSRELKRRG